ncbi:hypothetical protein [Pseudoalteromonas sp.]|uniref:hypothetical protein n=1 Tax=Pseudoalteromonas sp. TaxID=53249 RepID=UPI00257ED99E|nr:hypothetical protein [Pseudoalteromonas sp.]
MFNNIKLAQLIILISLGMTLSCYAECDGEIKQVEHGFDSLHNYKPNQDAEKFVTVKVSANNDCQYYLVLESQTNFQLTGQFREIPYYIKDEQSGLSNSPFKKFNITDDKASLGFVIISGTVVKAGNYTDRLKIVMKNQHNEIVDEYDFDIDLKIPSNISLSFLGYSGTNATVNLGELKATEEYSLLPSLHIVANIDVIIRVDSQHLGKLKHETHDDKFAIDYKLAISNEYFELKSPITKQISIAEGDEVLLPLKIKLADFSNLAAGRYSDIIRFQVNPVSY